MGTVYARGKRVPVGGGSKSYFARAKVRAAGLNETLAKRLGKKNVEIFGYASP